MNTTAKATIAIIALSLALTSCTSTKGCRNYNNKLECPEITIKRSTVWAN